MICKNQDRIRDKKFVLNIVKLKKIENIIIYNNVLSSRTDTMASTLSPHATLLTELVLREEPVLVLNPEQGDDDLNPVWGLFVKTHLNDARMRVSYNLTEIGLQVLSEVNARRQPLIYVVFRFCRDKTLLKAILRLGGKTLSPLMSLRTQDGSTPLIGLAWEYFQGNRTDDEIREILPYVRPEWLRPTNHRGESAASFLSPFLQE